MENLTKLIVVVENESLFLPNLLAKLAQQELIDRIILLSPDFSYNSFKKNILRLNSCFGLITCFHLVLSMALGKIANIFFKYKFYSIQKISKLYNIPLTTIQKLHDQELYDLIEQSTEKVVFAQVSQKIKPDLLAKAVFWNKHCGLLPSYKGVYPIFWALLNLEPHIGVSIHVMNEEFDEGVLLSQAQIINHKMTFFKAYHLLYDLAAELLINLCLYNQRQTLDNAYKSSYYSFPTPVERKSFQSSNRFGFPFRLHPSVKPKS